jgi:hypothetical protein
MEGEYEVTGQKVVGPIILAPSFVLSLFSCRVPQSSSVMMREDDLQSLNRVGCAYLLLDMLLTQTRVSS